MNRTRILMRKKNEAKGDDRTSLGGQVAKLTTDKTADLDLLADIALDLDASEKTGYTIREGLAGIVSSFMKEKLSVEKIQSKI